MTSMIDNGIHPAVSRERYDSIERCNFSTLKLMARSPAHYRHGLIEPREDTDAMKLGRIVHLAVFEPERFRNAIAVWDGARRAGKEWEAFKERNAGKELLTEAQHATALAIQQAVRAHPIAAPYLQNGKGEFTMLWETVVNEQPIACKGRMDFDASAALVDLKSCRDASPSGFGRQAYALAYHAQSAWYADAYAQITGTRKPFKVIAIESAAPYVTQVYTVPEHVLELGRATYREWLDRMQWCRANSFWPGYSEQEFELELPRWAFPGDDEDLSGEGLTSGGAPLTLEA